MAKQLIILLVAIGFSFAVMAQVKIHSHNDYTHKRPFFEAIENKAFSIEADVFLIGDSLMVAHSKKEIRAGNTLENLYLKPLSRFSKTEDYYAIHLVIDIKDDWSLTSKALLKTLKKYQKDFGRQGRNSVVVITGNRPETNFDWANLHFDGLPNVDYSATDLQKIVMISDNFAKYSKWKGVGEISEADKAKLKLSIDNAHKLGLPFRFWGAPDNEISWKMLSELGADIINTDKVAEATHYFKRN
ncbi:hypothetical protein ASE92_08775 [Pedobacter sp. Leaf41]|uniref:phosphatidylinositol-specific phospholipase C/glycerophosphodiester phosphodiesterase family protein n=1 Tax=Pedobacter sp. Leaf41 TaxID=1736218 RepID=UPI00070366DA|nr:phosphatidylinositol-specific phospholipase C/glycerophosphodiester phosphodiesterase family protein [Pedobacter sp. Leaf41]KQN36206.1 hypothetical protein ASE92_08775 [Pedobacter sp. Leaf41]RZK65019.1 MAG: glycerophosphodiester phosphodiesterase [Pedobacter sp.]